MAIRRISELDLFSESDLSQFLSTDPSITDSSQATDENVDHNAFDVEKLCCGLWLEVSTPLDGLSCLDTGKWIVKPTNEAPSYYLSKKISAADLMGIFNKELKNKISTILSGPVYYIGSQNFGEPLCNAVDICDEYMYDNREFLSDDTGSETYPNRLCVMIKSDFTRETTFHYNTEFHSETAFHGQDGLSTVFHPTNTINYNWNGNVINLSGPWAEFAKDIVVNGHAYITEASITNLSVTNPIYGVAMSACWADLAENYSSDMPYPPGTLVKFGGEEEITIATDTVNAVVTTRPGFSLNGNPMKNGVGITLVGRVPVRTIGKIRKFDHVGLSEIPGVAVAVNDGNHIGIALESSDTEHEKLVECIVQLSL